MAYRQQKRHYKCAEDAPEDLSKIVNELWEADDNKCYTTQEYNVDLQGWATTKRDKDNARYPLFYDFDEDNVFSRRTYKAFRALLDNYTFKTGEQEVVTYEEKQENSEFLDAILETDVMQRAKNFLSEAGKLEGSDGQFKRVLNDLWFRPYRRTKGDRDEDSSSFEHVFVGECKDNKIIGLHNWLQFYLQEKAGFIDYRGYFSFKTDETDTTFRLLAMQFSMSDEDEEDASGKKNMSSMFLGSSPEFEIAVYTIMHLCDYHGKYNCNIGEYEVELECQQFFTNHRDGRGTVSYVGTAFIGCQDK